MISNDSRRLAVGFTVAVTLLFLLGRMALAQDSVAAARDLYASAAYGDALTMLNRMEQGGPGRSDPAGVSYYRGLCLLALGKSGEATQAFETVVAQDPTYRPSDAEAPPRVRATLSEVRRRLLPAIVQQRYAEAKAAYDRKDFRSAELAFRQVLRELADPDIAAAAGQSPLTDLRTLAVGFHDLSAMALASALAPVAPSTPPPLTVAAASAVAPAARPAVLVHAANETNVLAPVAIIQQTPVFQGRVTIKRTGTLEVVINEAGAVESARMVASIDPRYDQTLLTAAKSWTYRPATLNGAPVKFRKVLQIAVAPTAP